MKESRRAWVWLDMKVMLAVHEEQLSEHGGGSGVRDPGLFESAMQRPWQLASSGAPDAAALAAAYGYGLARNRPFIDGNKRAASVAVELFLALNDQVLLADDAQCVMSMLELAEGQLTQEQFAQWVRSHLRDIS